MKKSKPNPLERALDEVLVQEGFVKVKKTWRFDGSESILVVNLQKSDWSNQYYVNLGVYFKAIGKSASPGSHECHVCRRLDALSDWGKVPDRGAAGHISPPPDLTLVDLPQMSRSPEHLPAFARALNLDDETVAEGRRVDEVMRAMREKGLAFLRACDSVPKVRVLLQSGSLRGAAVWKAVYDLCGVPFVS